MQVGLVIDLTNSFRYYKPEDFQRLDVEHYKAWTLQPFTELPVLLVETTVNVRDSGSCCWSGRVCVLIASSKLV